MDFALKSILCGIGLFCGHHLHESEATALAGVWVSHDVALLHYAVRLEEAGDLVLRQTWMDAGDEEIGAGIGGIIAAVLVGMMVTAAGIQLSVRKARWNDDLPLCTSVHRPVANAGVAIAVGCGRTRALTGVVAVVCGGG